MKSPAAPTLNDDDDMSVGSSNVDFGGTSSGSDQELPSERNEIKEILKMSKKDTRSVQVWRIVATCALLVTAFIVTCTSYLLLKQEEKNNFETAVSV